MTTPDTSAALMRLVRELSGPTKPIDYIVVGSRLFAVLQNHPNTTRDTNDLAGSTIRFMGYRVLHVVNTQGLFSRYIMRGTNA